MKEIYSLVGWSLNHSLSPAMHNAVFKHLKINAEYILMPVKQLGSSFRGTLAYQNVSGFNITIPHKTAIMDFIDEFDDVSRDIGAVNTVKIENDKLIATNTDVYGFLDSLSSNQISIKNSEIVVFGAGGAAKAICYGLAKHGAHLTIMNRTLSKAQEIADHLKSLFNSQVSILPYSTDEEISGNLFINATPLGSDGKTVLLSEKQLKNFNAVCDIMYYPEPVTPLLREAKKLGLKTIDGLEMLVNQGALAFNFWTNIDPPKNIMRNAALEAIKYGR